MNILVAQREIKYAEFISKGLKEEGYSSSYTDSFEEFQHLYATLPFDMIILDTLLSNESTLKLCTELRKQNNDIAIFFLSIEGNTEIKVKALNCGGDDYMVKPASFVELVARIRAILRRVKKEYVEKASISTITVKDLTLNYLTREVQRDSKKIELTTREYILLEYFIRNKNLVLTRTAIKEQIWGIDFISDTNIVDVYVNYLRNKIDKGFENKFFYTVRGAGYIFKA